MQITFINHFEFLRYHRDTEGGTNKTVRDKFKTKNLRIQSGLEIQTDLDGSHSNYFWGWGSNILFAVNIKLIAQLNLVVVTNCLKSH